LRVDTRVRASTHE